MNPRSDSTIGTARAPDLPVHCTVRNRQLRRRRVRAFRRRARYRKRLSGNEMSTERDMKLIAAGIRHSPDLSQALAQLRRYDDGPHIRRRENDATRSPGPRRALPRYGCPFALFGGD